MNCISKSYKRRATIRAKQDLRRDRTSCVGFVARLQKPKHMYLQGAVNWSNQSTLHLMMQHLWFSFMICWKSWTTVPQWYSLEQPKPLNENGKGKAYWHVLVFAENVEVRNNRIDATVINKEKKKVYLLEKICLWITNREKSKEKTIKYAPLRLELRRQHPKYDIEQHNIVIDVLGGGSANVRKSLRELTYKTLSRMQKEIWTNSLHIERSFKILA